MFDTAKKSKSVEIDSANEELIFAEGDRVQLRHINSISPNFPNTLLLSMSYLLFAACGICFLALLNSKEFYLIIAAFKTLLFAIALHVLAGNSNILITTSSGDRWRIKCTNKDQTLKLTSDLQTQIRNIFNNNKKPSAEKLNPSHTPISTADEVIKLKALLDQGALTQEEFSNEKKKVLSKAA